ncbi:uncharacterized protein BX663DRAFT_491928 [Cokeromyces recurvatus]|uniref:uncharacterized protein n=1 Tax=Cokeromyces recurvatus TaxID=90255 RepID=UPI00221FD561|nr:uncharacterized protein BX663DRAFT_491928 [Cokeromyces recurvatus]KAI7907754.1 hypothetical protein BX663DRAFT_491928 [Cokeromyces recurvatus]
MSEDNLNDLALKYQSLRNGSSKGADNDEKYKIMKTLGDQLGLPGTSAADILSKLGKPDELTPSLEHSTEAVLQTMPGPTIPTASSATTNQQPFYFVYYLEPKKDYLYFKIDPIKETVITSDWRKS